jgi:Uncharacterized protein conserved in bacteria (DUF2255)
MRSGFTAADPTVRTQVDEAYRATYGRYSSLVRPMISDSVAETTLQLQPTISWKDTYPMKATMLDGPGDVRPPLMVAGSMAGVTRTRRSWTISAIARHPAGTARRSPW